MSKSKRLFNNILRSSCRWITHNVENPPGEDPRSNRRRFSSVAAMVPYVRYLQGLVLPIGETSEGRQEVDVCALDKLLLCLAELLLSLTAPEQGHPCRHSKLLAKRTLSLRQACLLMCINHVNSMKIYWPYGVFGPVSIPAWIISSPTNSWARGRGGTLQSKCW